MILRAPHTHLYPGLSGTLADLAQEQDWRAGGDAVIEFSDGAATSARITRSGDQWLLHAQAYRTTAGTEITDKHWRIELKPKPDRVEFRILCREAAGDIDGRGH